MTLREFGVGCLVACTVCGVSFAFTGWVRSKAIAHAMLDVPNARSSHTVATPRGGGLAIVVSTAMALVMLAWAHLVDWRTVSGVCGGGALVAWLGFADDRRGVAPRWRLAGHFSAGMWLLALGGDVASSHTLGVWPGSGLAAAGLELLFVVWVLNLTNFMDGIDGIAAVETIFACAGAVALSFVAEAGRGLWAGPVVLGAAAAGFLGWNWPPAKIFMGDVGSGFVGFSLAAFALQAGWVASRMFWCWAILLGVFIVDATVTVVRRVLRGEKPWEAHRSHAYQHAALQRKAHAPVTIAVALIDILWLLPVAYLVAAGRLDPRLGLAIAYAPLIAAAILMDAGVPTA